MITNMEEMYKLLIEFISEIISKEFKLIDMITLLCITSGGL